MACIPRAYCVPKCEKPLTCWCCEHSFSVFALSYADGVTIDTSTSDSETISRTTHQQQDEVIRQGNRQKAQQQKAPASADGQGSLSVDDHQTANELADRQTGPVTGDAQGAAAQAQRQQSLSKAQDQEAEKAAAREDSVQRTQAVVSPFTKATVHRQIGDYARSLLLWCNHA